MPCLRGDVATLRGQDSTIERLQESRRLDRQAETLADRLLQNALGFGVQSPQLTSVLERVREVNQIGLGGVMQQSPQRFLAGAAFGTDEIGHDARVLGDREERSAVTAEAALV